MKILVVGNGFVGSNIYKHSKHDCTLISHNNIDQIDFSKFNVVINTALNPFYRNSKYDESLDIDRKIVQKCTNQFYIMFSSRKVYGNFKELTIISEEFPYDPFDHYSENKVITEQYLLNNYSNTIIFRGSNFFGYELNRSSFIGYCLTSLFCGDRIKLSINKNTIRDFLHISHVVTCLDKVIDNLSPNVFNMGLSEGFNVEYICEAIIDGYKKGKLSYSTYEEYDQQFILDSNKLFTHINYKPPVNCYYDLFFNLGVLLEKDGELYDYNCY